MPPKKSKVNEMATHDEEKYEIVGIRLKAASTRQRASNRGWIEKEKKGKREKKIISLILVVNKFKLVQ